MYLPAFAQVAYLYNVVLGGGLGLQPCLWNHANEPACTTPASTPASASSSSCPANTANVNGQCISLAALCGPGTSYDSSTHSCKATISCGPNTTLAEGKCVPDCDAFQGVGRACSSCGTAQTTFVLQAAYSDLASSPQQIAQLREAATLALTVADVSVAQLIITFQPGSIIVVVVGPIADVQSVDTAVAQRKVVVTIAGTSLVAQPPSSSSQPSASSGSNISAGAIVGIVFAVLLALAGTAVGVYLVQRRPTEGLNYSKVAPEVDPSEVRNPAFSFDYQPYSEKESMMGPSSSQA